MKDTERFMIRPEKVDELKAGRTNIYLEDLIGFSRQYISEIFMGKRIIDRKAVKKILIPTCSEHVKLNAMLQKDLDKTINYFFKKI